MVGLDRKKVPFITALSLLAVMQAWAVICLCCLSHSVDGFEFTLARFGCGDTGNVAIPGDCGGNTSDNGPPLSNCGDFPELQPIANSVWTYVRIQLAGSEGVSPTAPLTELDGPHLTGPAEQSAFLQHFGQKNDHSQTLRTIVLLI
jgi:hypothetical protein